MTVSLLGHWICTYFTISASNKLLLNFYFPQATYELFSYSIYSHILKIPFEISVILAIFKIAAISPNLIFKQLL